MDDPQLIGDEYIILRTPNIFVKSVLFDAILTNKRIILVDQKDNLTPPRDIQLDKIQDVEPGENAIRDQIITISVITGAGDSRQMVLTFSSQGSGNRKKERDEWVKRLQEHASASIANAIHRIVPSFISQPEKKDSVSSSSQTEITGRPVQKKEIEGIQPIKKIMDTSRIPPKPIETTSLPSGKFCTYCGNRIPADSVFCKWCRAKVYVTDQEIPEKQTPGQPVYSKAAKFGQPDMKPVAKEVSPRHQIISNEQAELKERQIGGAVKSAEPQIEHPEPEDEQSRISGPQHVPPSPAIPEQSNSRSPVGKPVSRVKKLQRSRSIFPQLFFGKEKQKQSLPSGNSGSPRSPRSGVPGYGRNLFITVVVLIVIIAIAAGAIVLWNSIGGTFGAQKGSGGQSPSASPRPTAGPPVSVPTPTPVLTPGKGVWIRVDYLGSWTGSYGKAGELVQVIDSGLRQYEVEYPNGTILASFKKQDRSLHELIVEVYQNSVVIQRNVTTAPFGSVDVSVDIIIPTPVTTATSGEPTIKK